MAMLEEKKGTSVEGLSSQEAAVRLVRFGKNCLIEKKEHPFLRFLGYFWGPIPWMIELAMILSLILHHYDDFFIIAVLLLVNGFVGFREEHQAGNIISQLKKKLAIRARVKRDGKWQDLDAVNLVPGDYVRLRIGEIIPADIILANGDAIEVDQSTLTGESLPVEKKSGDVVYSGSIVRRGEIEGVVKATGAHTYFGKTAQLVQETKGVSHFQKAVLAIGKYLIVMALILVLMILVIGVFRGENFLTLAQFCLVLTVAAIPVAMPTVLSITMAIGAKILAAKQAIVTKLSSIEELAGIEILCSDKTGTLTENALTLGKPYVVEGVFEEDLLLYAALSSREEDHDQIDTVIVSAVDPKKRSQYSIVHFSPFDPVHKRSEALVGFNGTQFMVTKGAVQVISEISHISDEERQKIEKVVHEFSVKGYRSLAVAISKEKDVWQFLGIIPLYDPPRKDAKKTVLKAEDMGIDVKMVTGDQIGIAREISKNLGLGENILDASTLVSDDTRFSNSLAKKIHAADGFAQVFPEHKYGIVKALQEEGMIVGMTGDGVNDAPALKKADVGIAVFGSTDAANAAASIVLLKPGLGTIIDAIIESRKIFQRMTSYAIYRITETIRILLFMTLSIVFFKFYPITALMIVLLAILNDGAIISIAYDKAFAGSRPEAWNMRLVLTVSTVLGVCGVVASFLLLYLGIRIADLSKDQIQSLMYLKLSLAGHLTIFLTRTQGPFWASAPSKILLFAVLGTQCIATLIAVYGMGMAPLSWTLALFVWMYAFIWFCFNDLVKCALYRFLKK